MKDIELINAVKDNNDEQAFQTLMERHSGIFHLTVSKFIPPSFSSSEKQIVYEEKPSIFFEAIQSFNPELKYEFITWLANKTRYICLSHRSKEIKKPYMCEFNDAYGGSTDLSPELYLERKDEVAEIISIIGEKFGDKTQRIMKERYFGGKNGTGRTFSEISKDLNISPQAVQHTHKKVVNYLKNRLKNT